MKTYLVGGAVRDELLGRAVHDKDYVVVGATIEQMLADGYQQVGADFPVFLHPQSKDEYALARTERKSGSGYKGFTVDFNAGVTLEEDLLRRDLTINAIAKDDNGELVDPWGGCKDLQARILRHVSKAFAEDPLRVLRVARFAAQLAGFGFKVDPQTVELMRQLAESGELGALTVERVYKETEKALLCDAPQVYFEVLEQCGALTALFAELAAPKVFKPAMAALEQSVDISPLAEVRWGAMLARVEQGQGMSERLKVPLKLARCARLAHACRTRLLALEQADGAQILDLLKTLDGLRKVEAVEGVALACKADAMANEDCHDYPQAGRLLAAQQACLQVIAKPFVEQGFKGAAIGEQMDLARQSAIAALLG